MEHLSGLSRSKQWNEAAFDSLQRTAPGQMFVQPWLRNVGLCHETSYHLHVFIPHSWYSWIFCFPVVELMDTWSLNRSDVSSGYLAFLLALEVLFIVNNSIFSHLFRDCFPQILLERSKQRSPDMDGCPSWMLCAVRIWSGSLKRSLS